MKSNERMVVVLVLVLLIVGPPLIARAADGTVLDNLVTAFDRESNSRERYIGFIDLANEERQKSIASLYRAVAASKAVQLRNYRELIKSLGGMPKTKQQEYSELQSLKAQLEYALNEESFKCEKMYPALMGPAEVAKNADLMLAFYFARAIAEVHAALFRETLSNRDTWKRDRVDYRFCPVCGNTVRGKPEFGKCPFCGTPAMSYVTVN